jgi:ammonium transporter Rh
MAGGILSSLGFAYIGPWLAESKIALADTCGVHSLHGMPGVFAAIVSMIYLCTLESKNFPKDYFYFTDPGNYIENKGLPTEKAGETGTYNDQAVAQLKSLLVTLAISIVSGLSGGFLCSLDFWKPVHALFRDDDHFTHVLEKYPKHYLENVDESIQYGKVAISNI